MWPGDPSHLILIQIGLGWLGSSQLVSEAGLSGSRDVGESKKDKYGPGWLDLIKSKYGPRWLDLIKSKTFLHFK